MGPIFVKQVTKLARKSKTDRSKTLRARDRAELLEDVLNGLPMWFAGKVEEYQPKFESTKSILRSLPALLEGVSVVNSPAVTIASLLTLESITGLVQVFREQAQLRGLVDLFEIVKSSARRQMRSQDPDASTATATPTGRQCLICYEEIELGEAAACFTNAVPHVMHVRCSDAWLKVSPKAGCPICRSSDILRRCVLTNNTAAILPSPLYMMPRIFVEGDSLRVVNPYQLMRYPISVEHELRRGRLEGYDPDWSSVPNLSIMFVIMLLLVFVVDLITSQSVSDEEYLQWRACETALGRISRLFLGALTLSGMMSCVHHARQRIMTPIAFEIMGPLPLSPHVHQE
jgi:hypothetical protein